MRYDNIPKKIFLNDYNYPSTTVFTVYTRRSNSTKRLLHTGLSLSAANEAFTTFKVFHKDYKYLYAQQKGVKPTLLCRDSGQGQRTSYQGKRLGANYATKELYKPTMPKTLHDLYLESIKYLKDSGNIQISQSKALPLILSHFCSLSIEDRQAVIIDYEMDVTKHIFLSGGDNSKRVNDYLIDSAKKENEEELL